MDGGPWQAPLRVMLRKTCPQHIAEATRKLPWVRRRASTSASVRKRTPFLEQVHAMLQGQFVADPGGSFTLTETVT